MIELNVEGVSRFVALFQTNLAEVGPVRSARTSDLDLLSAMNRPVFAYSGANVGVNAWVAIGRRAPACSSTSPRNATPCYRRTAGSTGAAQPAVRRRRAPSALATTAGPARPLWDIDRGVDTTGRRRRGRTTQRSVAPMDGVRVEWTWDPTSGQLPAVAGRRRTPRRVRRSDRRPQRGGAVVQHVPSPVDTRSPNPITVGTGAGVVHRGGRAIPVVWSRATAYDKFVFRHATTGAVIPLDVGITFIELERER